MDTQLRRLELRAKIEGSPEAKQAYWYRLAQTNTFDPMWTETQMAQEATLPAILFEEDAWLWGMVHPMRRIESWLVEEEPYMDHMLDRVAHSDIMRLNEDYERRDACTRDRIGRNCDEQWLTGKHRCNNCRLANRFQRAVVGLILARKGIEEPEFVSMDMDTFPGKYSYEWADWAYDAEWDSVIRIWSETSGSYVYRDQEFENWDANATLEWNRLRQWEELCGEDDPNEGPDEDWWLD